MNNRKIVSMILALIMVFSYIGSVQSMAAKYTKNTKGSKPISLWNKPSLTVMNPNNDGNLITLDKQEIDLNKYFNQPDGKILEYTVKSDNNQVHAKINNNKMFIKSNICPSTATLTIKATDQNNNFIEVPVKVNIINPVSITFNDKGYFEIQSMNNYWIKENILLSNLSILKEKSSLGEQCKYTLKDQQYNYDNNEYIRKVKVYVNDFNESNNYSISFWTGCIVDMNYNLIDDMPPIKVGQKYCSKQVYYEDPYGYFNIYSSSALREGRIPVDATISIEFNYGYGSAGQLFSIQPSGSYSSSKYDSTNIDKSYKIQSVGNCFIESNNWKYGNLNQTKLIINYNNIVDMQGRPIGLDKKEEIDIKVEKYKGSETILLRDDILEKRMLSGQRFYEFIDEIIYSPVGETSYEVSSSDSSIVDVNVDNVSKKFDLHAKNPGKAEITIVANDTKGNTRKVQFTVNVNQSPVKYTMEYDNDSDINYILATLNKDIVNNPVEMQKSMIDSIMVDDCVNLEIIKSGQYKVKIYALDENNNKVKFHSNKLAIRYFWAYEVEPKINNLYAYYYNAVVTNKEDIEEVYHVKGGVIDDESVEEVYHVESGVIEE